MTPQLDSLPNMIIAWNWLAPVAIYVSNCFRVLILYPFNKRGEFVRFFVALGFILLQGSLYQNEYEFQAANRCWSNGPAGTVVPFLVAFAFPILFAVGYFLSEGWAKTKRGKP